MEVAKQAREAEIQRWAGADEKQRSAWKAQGTKEPKPFDEDAWKTATRLKAVRSKAYEIEAAAVRHLVGLLLRLRGIDRCRLQCVVDVPLLCHFWPHDPGPPPVFGPMGVDYGGQDGANLVHCMSASCNTAPHKKARLSWEGGPVCTAGQHPATRSHLVDHHI